MKRVSLFQALNVSIICDRVTKKLNENPVAQIDLIGDRKVEEVEEVSRVT
jgi:hypothetical protein